MHGWVGGWPPIDPDMSGLQVESCGLQALPLMTVQSAFLDLKTAETRLVPASASHGRTFQRPLASTVATPQLFKTASQSKQTNNK